MSVGTKIVVVGAGAFGTALASVAAASGNDVTLVGRDAMAVEAMRRTRRNEKALPGIDLPETLAYSVDAEVLRDAGIVLFAMPSQAQRQAARALAPLLAPGTAVVVCAKGMEKGTGRLLTDVLEEELPGREIAVLSGPGFAADIAGGLPTAMVIAARTAEIGAALAQALSGPTFSLYPSTDRIGVQLGGALKNVLAIAAGAAIGAGLGASAQAAIVTRGFVELRRIGASFGARPETLMGLSGLGDLVLTCGSAQSRNFAYGLALGRGDSVVGLKLAEGVATAGIAASIAAERGIRAPITDAVDRMLAGSLTIDRAVEELLSRPLRAEDE